MLVYKEGSRMGNKLILLMIGAAAGFSIVCWLLTSCGITKAKHSFSLRSQPHRHRREAVDLNVVRPVEVLNTTVADHLQDAVRVLCWVMTYPDNHEQARHVKATWGKRCNVLLFMSTEEDDSLPTVKLAVREGKDHLWGKTKAAFRYVYEYYRDHADWFLKVEDDTYVIVENLRYMLAEYDHNDPLYFGCRFKCIMKQGYMSGGAGYVLSREALERFVRDGLSNHRKCKGSDFGPEDFEMGKCLSNLNVLAADTRDAFQRGRFFPFQVKDHVFPNRDKNFWYWDYQFYPDQEGLGCCSHYPISFHCLDEKQMFVMEYMLYGLRIYGVGFSWLTNNTFPPNMV